MFSLTIYFYLFTETHYFITSFVKYCKAKITLTLTFANIIIFMKAIVFLISLAGFAFSSFSIITDFPDTFRSEDLIYLTLLIIVLANSIVGITLSLPERLLKKK